MSILSSEREAQLDRKLQLLLGSGPDWLNIYGKWCAENDISHGEDRPPDCYDDHNINLFVKQQKEMSTCG